MFLTDGILASFLLSILDLDFCHCFLPQKDGDEQFVTDENFFIPQTVETYLELLNLAIIGCSFST